MIGRLYLEDGTTLTGTSFGASTTTLGELVFNTGMSGYQEILTDPSYAGQTVMMTYPLIGNYGINQEDTQSAQIQAKGLIVSRHIENFSNWKGEITLSEYLNRHGIFGLSGVDTRMLTRAIRDKGTMKCILSTTELSKEAQNQLFKDNPTENIVSKVSTQHIYRLPGQGPKIALIDLGVKQGIIQQLQKLGCEIQVYPWNVSAKEILLYSPDAVLFSNGPGDPKDVPGVIKMAQELIGKLPLFGICLGLQVLGLALGGDTGKLPFGHRGSNHAVINLQTGKVTMTAQNHGYALINESLPKEAIVTHRNVNDNTIEGFIAPKHQISAVQFHPEAGPGPKDSQEIFSQWLYSLTLEEDMQYA